jgi:hypothetical protein
MKRILLTTILILMLSLLVAGPVSAKNDKFNIKGEVTKVSAGTITVLSNKGISYEIALPDGLDLSTIKVGDSVLVKGQIGEDGSIRAESITLVGKGNNTVDSGENTDQADGGKDNSAYCADGKQVKPHPLAVRIAERYSVTESWVMEHFCEGYGMGQIMLALKTSEIEGVQADPESLLTERANGVGWGNIWKNLGLIGSEREGHSPPGLLKKPDQAGPKNKD